MTIPRRSKTARTRTCQDNKIVTGSVKKDLMHAEYDHEIAVRHLTLSTFGGDLYKSQFDLTNVQA